MNIAITTYPGHAFSTYLTVKSIREHISNDPITLIVDDFFMEGWATFIDDIEQLIPNVSIRRYGELQGSLLATVGKGWFRQQLVKMNVDRYLDGDVLIVDGDVIFDESVDLSVVPLKIRPTIDSLDIGFDNYVKQVLKVDVGHIDRNGYWCATSPIPFRFIEQGFLTGMREYISKLHGVEFTQFHIQEIHNGNMEQLSEWELIEVYRQQISDSPRPCKLTDAGNHTFGETITNPGFKYRHSSMKDDEIGRGWFQYFGVPITDELWQKSQEWHRRLIR